MAKSDCKKKYDNKNLIFILCGPSGVGKTSLKISLLKKHRDVRLCPSVTTRPETQVSRNIKEYHHISDVEYERLYKNDELIAKKVRQFGFYYGIKRGEIIDILDQGHHVLLETTLWGVNQLKNYFNNVISIFVTTPSLVELERRLKSRGRENDEDVVLRLDLAKQILANFKENMVDYHLINDDLTTSIDIVNSIVSQEKLKLGDESTSRF